MVIMFNNVHLHRKLTCMEDLVEEAPDEGGSDLKLREKQ